MKKHNIDIFGLAETNLAWSPNHESTAKYYGQKLFKQLCIVTCASDDPLASTYQPGGVCMGVAGATIGCILEMTKDPT
eukprot:6095868-Ditylum_brightwellii.AAC.1